MYYRQSAKGLLLFLFALALLFFATTPASAAASLPHAPKDVQCLIVAVQSQVVGSQQFNIVTQVTNTCLATFTITTRINTQQTDCPPYATTSTPFTVQLQDQQTAVIRQGYTSGCVVCENLVPVSYPSFTIRVTALAFGTFTLQGAPHQATSNTAAAVPDITLSNTPHPYVPPCP